MASTGRRDTRGNDAGGDDGMTVEQIFAQSTSGWAGVKLSEAVATPLHSSWSLWYTRKEATQRQKDGINYEALIKRLGTFSTVEQFWALYSHCLRPGDMIPGTDYHLFREGIKPMWEDVHNREGGKLSVRIRKKFANNLWESLMMALLGEQLSDDSASICGGVVGIRFQEDVLSVWNRSTAQAERQFLGENLRTVLNLPENVYLDYKEHDRSLTRLYRPPQQRGENAFNATQPSDAHQSGAHVQKHVKEPNAESAPSGAAAGTRPRNSWWNTRVDGDSSSGGQRSAFANQGQGRPSFDSAGGDWSTLRAGGTKPHETGNATGTRTSTNNAGVRLGLLPLPPDGGRRTEISAVEQPHGGTAGGGAGAAGGGAGTAGGGAGTAGGGAGAGITGGAGAGITGGTGAGITGGTGAGITGAGITGAGITGGGGAGTAGGAGPVAAGSGTAGYDSHDWRKYCSGVGGGAGSTSGLKGNTGVAGATFGAMATTYSAQPKQRAHPTQHPAPLPATTTVSQPHSGGDDVVPRSSAGAWVPTANWSKRAAAVRPATGFVSQSSADSLKRRPGGAFGTASGHLGSGWGTDPINVVKADHSETAEAERKQAEEFSASEAVGRSAARGQPANIFNLPPARAGGNAWGVK